MTDQHRITVPWDELFTKSTVMAEAWVGVALKAVDDFSKANNLNLGAEERLTTAMRLAELGHRGFHTLAIAVAAQTVADAIAASGPWSQTTQFPKN